MIYLFNISFLFSGFGAIILLVLLVFVLLFILKKANRKLLKANHILQEEIRQLRTELKRKNHSLEEEIKAKTEELENEIKYRKAIEIERKIALKKAEEASFLKNAFLANMSHEIRTPLNGIIGFSHLLLSEVEYNEKPELVDFAEGIAESSDRLLNLMEHIIDLSRIDANDYEVKSNSFEANSLINGCIERIKKDAHAKKLDLQYDEKEVYHVQADKAALEKSIDLILNNAITYTNEGFINLSLQSQENWLLIKIEDSGIGIDPKFLTAIFEAFRQESTGYSRVHQGAGLGLPLAQKLIGLMKGKIEIQSEKGQGTTVSIFIPLDSDEHEYIKKSQNRAIPYHNTSQKKPLLFIVEDDKMNRMVFEKMLKNNADYIMAIDGDDAFSQYEKALKDQKNIDLILLDINLPEPWDGMLLLDALKKKWPQLNKLPFVAQTAYAMTGDKEKFLAAGFDDYISKPIDKKQLLTIIDNNMRIFNNSKPM